MVTISPEPTDTKSDPTLEYTPAQIMAAISLALKEHDMPAAAGLVRLLALKDPHSAQMIADAVEALS